MIVVGYIVVGYILSVIIGWLGGRYMELDNRNRGGQPIPLVFAVIITFVPIFNVVIGIVGLLVFLGNKSKIFDSRKFYRLNSTKSITSKNITRKQ